MLGRYSQQQGIFTKERVRLPNFTPETWGFLQELLAEFARVLRPVTGLMVLLCGSFSPILDALQRLNSLQPNGTVWELPCKAVFPVNVGGIVAWVIKVNRGPAEAIRLPNHTNSVRKLTHKRDRFGKLESSKHDTTGARSKYR